MNGKRDVSVAQPIHRASGGFIPGGRSTNCAIEGYRVGWSAPETS